MNNQKFYTLYQISPGTLVQHYKCQIKNMFTPRLENKDKNKVLYYINNHQSK